jgi:hypothetical protein
MTDGSCSGSSERLSSFTVDASIVGSTLIFAWIGELWYAGWNIWSVDGVAVNPNETLQQIHNTEQSIVVFGIAAKADAMTNLII